MKLLPILASAVLLSTALAGCGRSVPAVQARPQAAAGTEARLFDRFEAAVTRDAKTGMACLALTAKGLVTRFTDEEFTVVLTMPQGTGSDEPERLLFKSPLFLGEDGFLYLRELSDRAAPAFYRAGAYGEVSRRGGEVPFKLGQGLRLEARNRSLLPVHGGGPFIAIVLDTLPMPAATPPHLVRSR